ncbi:MAG: hypothetical protein WCI71_05810 [Bacteroidota bacterium]
MATIDGIPQILLMSQSGTRSVEPAEGKQLRTSDEMILTSMISSFTKGTLTDLMVPPWHASTSGMGNVCGKAAAIADGGRRVAYSQQPGDGCIQAWETG